MDWSPKYSPISRTSGSPITVAGANHRSLKEEQTTCWDSVGRAVCTYIGARVRYIYPQMTNADLKELCLDHGVNVCAIAWFMHISIT